MITKTSCIKSNLLFAVSISFFLLTQTAHADFRKALEAYQNRDGTTMLAEVKDAVDKKNDDGLMLLLMATNLDADTSDYDKTTLQYQSTLRTILSQAQWDGLRNMLVKATNNSTIDSQYYLTTENRLFSRELIVKRLQIVQIKNGEQPKTDYSNQEINKAYQEAREEYKAKGVVSLTSDILKLAESGDPYVQTTLGFIYLGETGYYGMSPCELPVNASFCKSKNEAMGYLWLKQAAKTYERDGLLNEGMGSYATEMCNLFYSKSNNGLTDLRQAYLWCFLGANLGDNGSPVLLRKMKESGKLKLVAPDFDAVLNTIKGYEALFVRNIKEWPEWILEARKELAKEDLPVFSYLFQDYGAYALDVYADGRVYIKDLQSTGWKAFLMKLSPESVKRFLADLHKIGIGEWPLYSGLGYPGEIIGESPLTKMRVTLRNGSITRRLYLRTYRENTGYPDATEQNIAKVKVLVDTYFPTKQLRIELGNSEKIKQKAIEREKKWIELAKKGEQK